MTETMKLKLTITPTKTLPMKWTMTDAYKDTSNLKLTVPMSGADKDAANDTDIYRRR